MMRVREQWIQGTQSDDLKEAFTIRVEVFCDEQGYTPEVELDGLDPYALHLLLWDGDQAIATGRLFWKENKTVGLGRIAVREAWRKQGVGSVLLDLMIKKARQLDAERIVLDSQCYITKFYESFGFTVCGKQHMDGHVPHIMMQKNL